MTFREALREGAGLLETSGSRTPYLDALVLLTEVLAIRKEELYARLTDDLPDRSRKRFHDLIERRAEGIPVAYLTNRKEFYGRDFYVDERVLIPRADTETLIDAAIGIIDNDRRVRRVHDLGTGSGCIAISIALQRPDLAVSASDSERGACEVFRINAERFHTDIPLYETAYFDSIPGPFDLIVSNPPYLTDEEATRMDANGWPEPQVALRGGADGLAWIAQIIYKSVHLMMGSGRLLLEAAPPQMAEIRRMMDRAGFGGLFTVPDLSGRERVVGGVKNG